MCNNTERQKGPESDFDHRWGRWPGRICGVRRKLQNFVRSPHPRVNGVTALVPRGLPPVLCSCCKISAQSHSIAVDSGWEQQDWSFSFKDWKMRKTLHRCLEKTSHRSCQPERWHLCVKKLLARRGGSVTKSDQSCYPLKSGLPNLEDTGSLRIRQHNRVPFSGEKTERGCLLEGGRGCYLRLHGYMTSVLG